MEKKRLRKGQMLNAETQQNKKTPFPKKGRLDSVKELLRDRNFRDLILEIIRIMVGSRR